MPEPSNYDNESDWMSACVPKMIDEGREQDQAVAACMSMWREKKSWGGMSLEQIIHRFLAKEFTNELKAVSETDDELRVKNYIVLFGGRDLEGIGSRRKNQDGSIGEYFAKNVDVESSYTKTGRLYVDWEHGNDPDGIGNNPDEILGYVDWTTARRDEKGIEVERVLNRRAKYMQWLEVLIREGLVGNSSMPVQGAAEKKANGEITRWPLMRDTLTVTPMEPRMMNENVLQAYKSLDLEAASADKSKQTAGKVPAIQPPAKAGKENDMDEKELKAMLEDNNKSFTSVLEANQKALLEKVNEQAEAAAKKAVEDVLDKLPEVKAKMNGRIEVTVDEADREFKSIGENCIAVYQHSKGIKTHPRIRGLQAKAIAAAQVSGDKDALETAYKAALGSNEAIPSQGEFLLEPTITSTLLKPMHETGIFSTKVNRLPVGPNSNSGWIPGVDETNRGTGSRWGGVRGYHSAEAGSMTASQPKFRRINWELHKIYVLQYATDELLADAGMLTAIINQSSAEELDFMVNDDLLNGIGVDRPVGVLNSPALISVGRYTASKVNHIDLVNMWQRLIPRMKGGAEWYINSEVEPQLQRLAFTSNAATTEMMSPFVTYRSDGTLTIFGRPVNTTEYNAALGTAGDLLLANFSDYLFWEKGAIEAAMSIHVQFLTDQTAFRFIARYDGQTALASAITPYKGTNTQSPFVTLASTTG